MTKINKGFFLILILLLIFTRFINIGWGLPYPFHPDERNIAVSLEQLTCNFSNIKECLNPHFFAYGQFYIYLGFFVYKLFLFITSGSFFGKISFFDSFLTLRSISALASIITAIFSVLIIKEFFIKKTKKEYKNLLIGGSLLLIFSPGLIQFAHFGTTESILMMFYSVLIYLSIVFLNKKISIQKYILFSSISIGLSCATKISSLIFLIAPFLTLFLNKKFRKKFILYSIEFVVLIFIVWVFFSPYNLIAFNDFIGTLRYESNVATGATKVFYTTQFEYTVPIIFQFINIFPFVLGIPVLILFLFGILFLKPTVSNNLLRVFFFIYFVPTAFLYTKWTRFMTPILPLMIVIGFLFLIQFKDKYLKKIKLQKIIYWLIIFISIVPGIAFLSIYLKDDIRVEASKWINKNIPSSTVFFTESGNVIDVPTYIEKDKNFNIVSVDFYNLENNEENINKLNTNLNLVEYYILPSRRVFANYTCEKDKDVLSDYSIFRKIVIDNSKKCIQLEETYPVLNNHYKMLFDDKQFKKIKEFTPYPRIELFGKKIFEIKDEMAEETFSVFDHPVIRIYKRI